jgi:hypothetical protein
VLKGLSAAVVFVGLVAGCGDGAHSHRAALHQIPQALARDWEGRASEIAAVASAGDSCRALQLASSLRNDVVSSQDRLPVRLRAPLLTGVNSLADRITCTPTPPAPKEPPKPPQPRHGHHGHGHGDGGGDGNSGGNDQ